MVFNHVILTREYKLHTQCKYGGHTIPSGSDPPAP